MSLRIRLFGRLADQAGWRDRQLDAPPSGLGDVIRAICQGDALLISALEDPCVQIALDQEIIERTVPIPPVGELAFLPPLSGG